MQNNVPAGSYSGRDDLLAQSEGSLSYENAQQSLEQTPSAEEQSDYVVRERRTRMTRAKYVLFFLVALVVLAGGIFTFMRRSSSDTRTQVGAFGDVRLPLSGILSSEQTIDDAQSLKVNGRLQVDNSITLTPSSQPANPTTGQLYFDKSTTRLTYYDGQQFIELQGAAVGTTQITSQVTNIFGGAGSSITLNGTPGNIAMFTGANALGDSLISQSGTTLNILPGAGTINAGTAGITEVRVGSLQGTSSTSIQSGTGNLSIATGSAAEVTGSISIKSGDSSTTASGNITIDAGEGVISGEIVKNKTYESGTESTIAWFGGTVAQTSAQAHSGTHSLEMTTADPFWGVEELLPGTAVTPGHQYYFSAWVRAGSAPRTINGRLVWNGTGGQVVNLTPVVDSTTGWTQISGTAPAPATATSAYFQFSSSGATIGEKHYFDDITLTDLSSSAAISAISIGAENAKIITIGNLNQVGATSIFGSSGIQLNSGAAGTTINGGVITITGNAASSLSTSSGALTLTSATSATWGINTATSGIGGDLTLRAGRGGTDGNNDGGDLILQGGNPNGTGTAGSVIVRPQTDVPDAFQIQNSTGTPLLIADSSTMKIIVAGTDTAFATLALDNAHFGTTQTTPPTINAPINCGASANAAVMAGSTDVAGSFTITTGTGGTASTCDTTITFHQTYSAAPKSIIVVGKTTAASAVRQIYVASETATSFTVVFGASAAGADNTAYEFSYWIIE